LRGKLFISGFWINGFKSSREDSITRHGGSVRLKIAVLAPIRTNCLTLAILMGRNRYRKKINSLKFHLDSTAGARQARTV
jgi:hypothetical protein